MDKFGIFLAGFFRAPTTASLTISGLVDVSGVARDLVLYREKASPSFVEATGAGDTQVGKGTTPATRQDINTETPFTNAPESGKILSTLPFGYVSGLGKISQGTLIAPTGGSGAISEATKFIDAITSGGLRYTYLIFRDNISPVVNFINGESINVEHEVLI